MKRLNHKIFKNIMVVSLSVLVATLILTIFVIYGYYSNQYITGVKNEAKTLSGAIDIGGTDYLDSIDSDYRLTLVASDGNVIYDNEAKASEMENHSDREEIKEAIKKGEGYAERYSSTLSEKTINAAILLRDGTILRVSNNQYTVISLLSTLLLPLIVISAAAILFSLFLAARISRSITSPINKIDLEHPEETEIYSELSPLIKRIDAQNTMIAHQMKDLNEQHELQDAMRRDFTANVSHELKTPLTSISGYAEIIKDGIAKEEDVRKFAGRIYDESQRLIILVGDIIKLSQLDGKDINVTVEEINLYETCSAVFTQLELAAKQKNVTMTLSGEHLKINGAEQIVEEIIFNLCDNAVKYNRSGGTVSVNIKQCVDGVELTVKDTGIGIPQEDLPHIFERFFRVDKSHSKEIGGTGLGLSIVKHGANFMNAKLSVESKPNKGTEIRVLF